MTRPITSFDVFDTLIARRSVEPHQVLQKLEAQSGLPGLAAIRLAADHRLGGKGQSYHLQDIWQEVQRSLGLDDATTQRLLELEIQLEHDEVIPISDNLAHVRDGDLLLSDSYLPADVVLSLLRRAGLQRTVGLVVTNDGKFRGWIWPPLLRQVAIAEHWGDNPHSDGQTPSQAGIKAIIYTGAERTPVEQFLCEQGWTPLANLVREARLANPLPDTGPHERYLWDLTCQLNFPLLFFASLLLERYARQAEVREVFFVSRDCLLWHHLYQQLFPHGRATYLYASRCCLLKPTASYLDYFNSTWHAGSVIVDLFSTGISWTRFFARLHSKELSEKATFRGAKGDYRARCFFIGRVDNYAYLQDSHRPDDWLEMTTLFRNSELGRPVNKGVEMLNYGSHPVVEDVRMLPGNAPLPVLAESLEYDPRLPEAAHQAFRLCVQQMKHYPDLSRTRTDGLVELIKAFVGTICADRQLPTIYAGHQAADEAYLRSILE